MGKSNRFSGIAEATSARLHGEGETVKVFYWPKENVSRFNNNGLARLELVYLNGAVFGRIWGAAATRLRKQHKLPCRKWVTMRLRLEAV